MAKESKPPARTGEILGDWHPLSTWRREVDRLFEDFPWRRSREFDVEPFLRGELSLAKAPCSSRLTRESICLSCGKRKDPPIKVTLSLRLKDLNDFSVGRQVHRSLAIGGLAVDGRP